MESSTRILPGRVAVQKGLIPKNPGDEPIPRPDYPKPENGAPHPIPRRAPGRAEAVASGRASRKRAPTRVEAPSQVPGANGLSSWHVTPQDRWEMEERMRVEAEQYEEEWRRGEARSNT